MPRSQGPSFTFSKLDDQLHSLGCQDRLPIRGFFFLHTYPKLSLRFFCEWAEGFKWLKMTLEHCVVFRNDPSPAWPEATSAARKMPV